MAESIFADDPIIVPAPEDERKRKKVPTGAEAIHSDPIIPPKISGRIEQLASGLPDGIADIVGMPMDIVMQAVTSTWDETMAIGGGQYAAPIPESVFLTSDFNKAWLRKIGVTAQESDKTADKILRFVGEFIGGGGVGAAYSLGKATVKGTTYLAKTYGTAARRAEHQFSSANKAARSVMEAAVADPEEAAKRLTTRADVFGLPSEKALIATHPGVNPSTAQLMGDPGLVGLENNLATHSAVAHAKLSDKRVKNMVAINDMYGGLAPAKLSDEHARFLLKSKVSVAVDSIEARMAAYKDGIDDLVQQGMSREQASVEYSKYIDELRGARKEVENKLWDSIDPDATFRADVKGLRAQSKAMIKDAPVTLDTDYLPTGIIGRIDRLGRARKGTKANQATFEELKVLRSGISEEIRKARQEMPGSQRERFLSMLQKEVENIFESQIGNATDAALATRYQEARDFTKQSAALFRNGPTAKLLKEGPQSIGESATLDMLFSGGRGSREAAQQLKAQAADIHGNPDDAAALVRDYVVRMIAEHATDANGNIKRAAFEKLLKKFGPALREFPEVRKELLTISEMQKQIDRLGVRAAQKEAGYLGVKPTSRQVQIERNAVSLFLDDPDGTAMAKMLERADKVREARRLRFMARKDRDAQQGLKRALWDEFTKQNVTDDAVAAMPFLNPKAMRKFINENRNVLTEFGYSKQEIENLQTLADQAGTVLSTRLPTSIAPIIKEREPLIPFQKWIGRFVAVKQGRLGPHYVAADAAARIVNRQLNAIGNDELQRLLTEAVVNPRFAAELLRPVRTAEERQRSIGVLFDMAIGMGIVTTQELKKIEEDAMREEIKQAQYRQSGNQQQQIQGGSR